MIKNYIKTKLNNFLKHSPVLEHNEHVLLAYVDYMIHKKRNTRVVYTCLTGDYDNLPVYRYFDPNWDYVCFTDNKNLLRYTNFGIWQIKPLAFDKLDNTRNNRWHKTHPHELFPDYEDSIYLDANICIMSPYLFDIVEEKSDSVILVPKHPLFDCIYMEIDRVNQRIVKEGREDSAPVQKMLDLLITENFPHHYGINENNCIYRKHKNSQVIELMNDWWYFIENYSKRDQLSFSYVLWKHGMKPDEIAIPNLRDKENDLKFELHNYRKK